MEDISFGAYGALRDTIVDLKDEETENHGLVFGRMLGQTFILSIMAVISFGQIEMRQGSQNHAL